LLGALGLVLDHPAFVFIHDVVPPESFDSLGYEEVATSLKGGKCGRGAGIGEMIDIPQGRNYQLVGPP
jgi:hypothetical protein